MFNEQLYCRAVSELLPYRYFLSDCSSFLMLQIYILFNFISYNNFDVLTLIGSLMNGCFQVNLVTLL